MKSEAIKRGLPYEKYEKYELESDEEQYDLTTYHNDTHTNLNEMSPDD
jgi:hypothetical protein